MGILNYSARESEITGVRIARSQRVNSFNEGELISDILDGQYDFCKLKVSANDDTILLKLRNLNIPLSIYSILVRNNKKINQEDLNYSPRTGLEFVPFNGSNSAEFGKLIPEIIANSTAINYANPEFQELVPEKKILEASTQFAFSFNHNEDPKKWAWLLKYHDEYVGFVLGEFDKDSFEGILHGVKLKFRGQHFGSEIMKFLNKTCAERGISYFKNDVVVQNLASLTNIIKADIRPVEFFFNVTINSFLTFTKLPIEKIAVPSHEANNIVQLLLSHLKKDNFNLVELKNVKIKPEIKPHRMEVSYPVHNEYRFLAVTKIYSQDDQIISMFYTLFQSQVN